MSSSRSAKQLAGAFIGFALCVSSTAAGAAAAAAPSISPLVALSAFATPLSARAVRATVPSAASLQMTAAAVQGAPDENDDQPVLPVLLGLAAFMALTALILGDGDGDGEINLPPPVSPD